MKTKKKVAATDYNPLNRTGIHESTRHKQVNEQIIIIIHKAIINRDICNNYNRPISETYGCLNRQIAVHVTHRSRSSLKLLFSRCVKIVNFWVCVGGLCWFRPFLLLCPCAWLLIWGTSAIIHGSQPQGKIIFHLLCLKDMVWNNQSTHKNFWLPKWLFSETQPPQPYPGNMPFPRVEEVKLTPWTCQMLKPCCSPA